MILHHCHKLSTQKDSSFPDNLTTVKSQTPAGFDLPGAIDNMGGDTSNYLRLANLFLTRLQDIRDNLHEQFLNNSPEAASKAAKLLHSLRGSAFTFGLVELANTTKMAEVALTTNETVDREELWTQLDKAFERVLTVLPDLLQDVEYN